MTQIFDNAVMSIRIGIEDFEVGTDERMLSAARNYYAGVLLLAKECLVQAAPEAEIMEVIGNRYKPTPDGEGGVDYVSQGYMTVDFAQLKNRFKDFGLNWPDVDFTKLQRFRNDIEHLHPKQPISAVKETIAASFTMIVDFFQILGEPPKDHLGDAWNTILNEHAAFMKVQNDCVASLEYVDWPAEVDRLNHLSCPACSSSLIAQEDIGNTDHEDVTGRCHRCGEEIDHEKMILMVVEASFSYDAYTRAKDGEGDAVHTCPECAEGTYVETGGISVCFMCGETVAGRCERCGQDYGINDTFREYQEYCSGCSHDYEKLMRE